MKVAAADVKNPYPGLRPFEPDDADFFFGRDQQIDELTARLHEHRFVGVLGLSGSGKSSLVRAGLIPALHQGNLASAGSRWRIAIMRPGAHPIEALADALRKALEPAPADVTLTEFLRSTYTEGLRESTRGLLKLSQRLRQPNESLLVVVDQFEELFRIENQRDASHFVDLLLAVTDDIAPQFRTYVVLTMRTDRLGECATFEGLPEALNRSQYLVPKLTPEQLGEAIEGPAALTDTTIDQGLVQQLSVSATAGSDRLPLLQHLLMILWEGKQPDRDGAATISREQYKAAGSAEEALNDHADRVYNEIVENLRGLNGGLTGRVFRALTGSEAGRDTRRPRRISQLAAETGESVDDVRALVEHFFASHFLTSSDRTPEGHATEDWEADITHESLIRQWKKLQEWVKEEARDAKDFGFFADNAERGAGPLSGGPLDTAVRWSQQRYNSTWAARYGGDLATTLAYIERSSASALLAAQTLEADRKKERARRFAYMTASVGLIVTIVVGSLATFAFIQSAKAKASQAEAEDKQRLADAAQRKAQIALDQAVQAVRDQLKAADAAVILSGFAQLSKVHGKSPEDIVSGVPAASLKDNIWVANVAWGLDLSESGVGEPLDSDLIMSLRSALRTAVGNARGIGTPRPKEEEELNRRVLIETGRFKMGSSPDDGEDKERPSRWVSLLRFQIQEHEVTNREYRRFDNTKPENLLPVTQVSWFEAMAYAFWVGGSLPSEAQWEFAARGPGEHPRAYPWGSAEPTCPRAQFARCEGGVQTVKTGRDAGKTPQGVYDLAGNVWEWCRDYYGHYPAADLDNPTGPASGSGRVVRGGSFLSLGSGLRAAVRYDFDPVVRGRGIGFRMVFSRF